MDAGGGRMNSCYNAMETIDNNLSFTDLLSLVAHEAENKKGRAGDGGSEHDQLLVHSLVDVCTQHNDDGTIDWNETNLNNAEADGIKNDRMFPFVLTAGQEKNKEINFSSQLPDESIDTCLFEDSSLICGSGNGLGDMVKSNGTRSYSTFNNFEEDCAAMDVTSQNKEYIGGPIEESMRKYCEDKKRVMFKPEVRMEFSSTEEAYQYYNMYSWVAGFSIKIHMAI
ncbi:hypothetical protein ACQ4PT_052197 [Festuca glaucescens]